MRGGPLACQWRVDWAYSLKGITVAKFAEREETDIRTIYSNLRASQAAGFPAYTEKVDHANRSAFIEKSEFKIPPPFNVSHFILHYFCKDLVWGLRRTFIHGPIHSLFKKIQSLFSPQTLSNLDQIQSVSHLEIRPYKDYAEFRSNGYN